VRVGKRADGDAHGIVVTLFAVEDGGPADRAEPESELGAPISDSDVFGGSSEDFERSGEARQRCEDAAGSLLTGEAVANADSARFAFDFNAQLSAGT